MPETQRSYCQIMVGRAMTGLTGLQEIMEALDREGIAGDDPNLGARLVAEVGKLNYVPPRAQADYEAALLREYHRFAEARASGGAIRAWRDPRKEHFPWFPTIFEAKCNGCGDCLPVCPNNVLGWNPEHTKVLVLEPYECAPGCQFCAKACALGAISMPPPAVLHRREHKDHGLVGDVCAACPPEERARCNQKGMR